MSQIGYTGIAFPFKFNSRGGVATSTTNESDTSHIEESIKQIVQTAFNERVNLSKFGSKAMESQFANATDEVELSVLKYNIADAIKTWESRVDVQKVTLTPTENNDGESFIVADIQVFIKKYLRTDNLSISLKVGESNA